ncbi:hypothetical protein [Egicoccus halophilus]|uniref:TIGR03089 family protein n=1 Tax=Egicoccus halophilus TaxID=1670830 RepID=A0A8J3ACP0_9ACTN|nr:hypothetical protein [Egicoccus halophilus]GGI03886.1 hypothetical protein GCM10011354_06290 [Egicoccus halophilus]
MQLAPPSSPRPAPGHLADALARARDELGSRPAVTVYGPERRDEQGIVSLAQWAAKGASLLELDLLLEPGDRLRVDLDPGWPLVAVALAAWWAGVAVTLDGDAPAAVVQEGRRAPTTADDVLWIGASVDGAPVAEVVGEAWVSAVQSFPDQPPPPRAAAELPAIVTARRVLTQAEVLTAAASLLGAGGTLGLDADTDLPSELVLVALAARPLLAARPTVLLQPGVPRSAADGEKVAHWA